MSEPSLYDEIQSLENRCKSLEQSVSVLQARYPSAWEQKYLDWYTNNQSKTCAEAIHPLPLPFGEDDAPLSEMCDSVLIVLFLLVQPVPFDLVTWRYLTDNGTTNRINTIRDYVAARNQWDEVRVEQDESWSTLDVNRRRDVRQQIAEMAGEAVRRMREEEAKERDDSDAEE